MIQTNRCRFFLLLRTLFLGAFVLIWADQGHADSSLPSLDGVGILETPQAISDFELIDQDGDSFSLRQLQGKVVLVFFGFTHCPDVCPTMMDKFRMLLESDRVENDDVGVVLISVDGDRDSPEVVKKFVRRFSSDIIGVTGPENEVKTIAKMFSASFYKGSEQGDGGYDVSHSSQAFVLNQDGLLIAEMFSPSPETMAGLINALSADD